MPWRVIRPCRAGIPEPRCQFFNQTVETELAYGLESLGLMPVEIERRLTWATEVIGLGHF